MGHGQFGRDFPYEVRSSRPPRTYLDTLAAQFDCEWPWLDSGATYQPRRDTRQHFSLCAFQIVYALLNHRYDLQIFLPYAVA